MGPCYGPLASLKVWELWNGVIMDWQGFLIRVQSKVDPMVP